MSDNPHFHIEGREIFRNGEKVGYFSDPEDHLRMTRGNAEHRDEIEAWMEQSQPTPDGAQGDPATGVVVLPHETEAEVDPKEEDETDLSEDEKALIQQELTETELRRRLLDSQYEVARLRNEIGKLRDHAKPRVPDRYADPFDDTGAPVQDPKLGDLTPQYVEWAREHMPKEIFARRYAGRLK